MGFNTEVFVKFKKKDTSPCPAMAPLKGIRAAMLLEIKTFFSKPLEPEYDPARSSRSLVVRPPTQHNLQTKHGDGESEEL